MPLVRALAATLLVACAAARAEAPPITHGPVVGEVSERGAVLWARAPGPGELRFKVEPRLWPWSGTYEVEVAPEQDFTGQVPVSGLSPDKTYTVTARYRDPDGGLSPPATASFRTAPAPGVARPVRFAMSGDLGGQGRCRRLGPDGVELGYPILGAIAALRPDFFIMNGDQIYADNTCPAEGPAESEIAGPWRNVPGPLVDVGDQGVDWTDEAALRPMYWEHWRYNREEKNFQALLARTAFYAQWDDHEVINDHGQRWEYLNQARRPGFPSLVRAGVAAFFAYNPILPEARARGGVYRSFRWGQDLELFLVDARAWRSPNHEPDTPEARKTMLGEAQRTWLLHGLLASDATWKVVSVDVPLAQVTGGRKGERGRDAWADGAERELDEEPTGFERELRQILLALDQAKVRNVVFLAADVHFAQIARFVLDLDGDGDPLVLYEVIAGPLSAGASKGQPPDPTFSPEVLYAEGRLFNFAWLTVDRHGGTPSLTVEIRGEDGTPRRGSQLVLQAR